MKFGDPFDNILSSKSNKNKSDAEQKSYFENTNDTLGLYKNPSLRREEDSDSEEDEENRPKGKALLKKIYGGACWKGYEQFGMKEKNGRQVPNCIPTPRSKSIKREGGSRSKLTKVSNFAEVQRRAKEIYGRKVEVSTRPAKKYQILNNEGKLVHFGDAKMEDFTKHLDEGRRHSYLSRALGIKGKWRDNPFSPNTLAILLLW